MTDLIFPAVVYLFLSAVVALVITNGGERRRWVRMTLPWCWPLVFCALIWIVIAAFLATIWEGPKE